MKEKEQAKSKRLPPVHTPLILPSRNDATKWYDYEGTATKRDGSSATNDDGNGGTAAHNELEMAEDYGRKAKELLRREEEIYQKCE